MINGTSISVFCSVVDFGDFPPCWLSGSDVFLAKIGFPERKTGAAVVTGWATVCVINFAASRESQTLCAVGLIQYVDISCSCRSEAVFFLILYLCFRLM